MLPPVALGAGDVAGLARFVAGAEEDDERPSLPPKIDAVAGAIVNPELVHAVAHSLGVAEVAEAKTGDAGMNPGTCSYVSQRP